MTIDFPSFVSSTIASHYVRVAAVTPSFEGVGNPEERLPIILKVIREAAEAGTEIVVLPELAVTGYTCFDLFRDPNFIRRAMEVAEQVVRDTRDLDVVIVFGSPWLDEMNFLRNVAIISRKGEVLGIVQKRYLPTGGEFQEARWYEPGEDEPVQVFSFSKDQRPCSFVVAVCEDDWHLLSPGAKGVAAGALMRINISGSNFLAGKRARRREMFGTFSYTDICAFVYTSVGSGEDSTDLVFDGDRFIFDNGRLLAEGDLFEDGMTIADVDLTALQAARLYNRVASKVPIPAHTLVEIGPRTTFDDRATLLRPVASPTPHVLVDPEAQRERCLEVDEGSIRGLMTRLRAAGTKKMSIGLSGGRDSTRAALVLGIACDRLGIPRSSVHSFTLTGPASREVTQRLSRELGEGLGFTHVVQDITEMATLALRSIGHTPAWEGGEDSLVSENAQARARTFVLMTAGFVVGTGNETEGENGYSTYNADHMSMYNPNGSLPKTLLVSSIQALCLRPEFEDVREIVSSILGQPISAELSIGQTTEAAIGDTEVVDYFYYHWRKGRAPEQIMLIASASFPDRSLEDLGPQFAKLVRAHARNQFKRDSAPGAPLLGSMSTSQRGVLRLPSDLRGAYEPVAQEFEALSNLVRP